MKKTEKKRKLNSFKVKRNIGLQITIETTHSPKTDY